MGNGRASRLTLTCSSILVYLMTAYSLESDEVVSASRGIESIILDYRLDGEERIEIAEGYLKTQDLVIAEKILEAAEAIDLGKDPSGGAVASKLIQQYWALQVEIASDREQKFLLLLAALEGEGDRRHSWTRQWAALQLCDTGAAFAWSSIEPILLGAWGERGVAVCRHKVELVELCGGNLLRAWELALKIEDPFSSHPIHTWAEYGLRESKSREAGKILLRHFVPRLPGSFWALTFISRDLKKKGWTDAELKQFGWTGRRF